MAKQLMGFSNTAPTIIQKAKTQAG